MKKFNCQSQIEEGASKHCCYSQCNSCEKYFKKLNEFTFEDYKKLEQAFNEVLNEHSKFMMHPILWKRFFKEKHNLNKFIE